MEYMKYNCGYVANTCGCPFWKSFSSQSWMRLWNRICSENLRSRLNFNRFSGNGHINYKITSNDDCILD